MTDIYLVAGATGGVGQQIVSRLLMHKHHVRALVRDMEKGRALLGENLELFEGDTRRIDTLHAAIEGVHTIICATGSSTPDGMNDPEHVDYEGVQNLVRVAQQSGVKRFVLISTIAVTRPEHPMNQFGHVLDWKREGENALRQSGLAYTIVRPGGLTDEPGGKAVRVAQGDQISGLISRADVAEVVTQVLNHDAAHNTTFEIIQADGEPGAWDALFASLKSDIEAGAHG